MSCPPAKPLDDGTRDWALSFLRKSRIRESGSSVRAKTGCVRRIRGSLPSHGPPGPVTNGPKGSLRSRGSFPRWAVARHGPDAARVAAVHALELLELDGLAVVLGGAADQTIEQRAEPPVGGVRDEHAVVAERPDVEVGRRRAGDRRAHELVDLVLHAEQERDVSPLSSKYRERGPRRSCRRHTRRRRAGARPRRARARRRPRPVARGTRRPVRGGRLVHASRPELGRRVLAEPAAAEIAEAREDQPVHGRPRLRSAARRCRGGAARRSRPRRARPRRSRRRRS